MGESCGMNMDNEKEDVQKRQSPEKKDQDKTINPARKETTSREQQGGHV